MIFSCEKAILQDAVLDASRGVSTKSTLPVLEGVLITAADTVSVCGYDLKTGVRCQLPATVEKEGAVVIGARILGDIIRKLPDEVVYFSCNEANQAIIRCGLSEFTLPGLPAAEFPALPEVDRSFSLVIPEKTLKSMISGTIFAISDNESKPVHTGSRFFVSGDKLEVASVDGFRLAVRTEKVEGLFAKEEIAFVVPGAALREVERMLGDTDKTVTIFPDRRFILFEVNGTVVITRLLDGEFLNYKKAVPEDANVRFSADVKALLTSVERVSLLVSERLKNPVRCLFDDSVVKLSCITTLGKAYDECRLEGKAPGLEIGFNSRYLMEALRACPDERAVLELKGSLAPCVIRPEKGDHFLYLVLPVRMKG